MDYATIILPHQQFSLKLDRSVDDNYILLYHNDLDKKLQQGHNLCGVEGFPPDNSPSYKTGSIPSKLGPVYYLIPGHTYKVIDQFDSNKLLEKHLYNTYPNFCSNCNNNTYSYPNYFYNSSGPISLQDKKIEDVYNLTPTKKSKYPIFRKIYKWITH